MFKDATNGFSEAMLPHMDELLGYAMHLTRNREDAQDLLQDTYLRALRGFRNFESGTNGRAWLYRIMKNSFINNYRTKQRTPAMVDVDDPAVNIPAGDLRDVVESTMLSEELQKAVSALPAKHREVIVLRDFEDLEYNEIARQIRVPVGTVRSRLNRGRASLRSALKDVAASMGYDAAQPMPSTS
jgi:RNA polymerase sigma-70 factor (ECF subfamily)